MTNEPRKVLMSPLLIMSLFIVPKILDLATTYVAVTGGYAYEGSVIPAYILSKGGWLAFSAFGLSVATLTGIVLVIYQNYLNRKSTPYWVMSLCRGGILFCSTLVMVAVANNLMVISIGIAQHL